MLASVGLVCVGGVLRTRSGGKLFCNAANVFRFQLHLADVVSLTEY
jgi:hypothetical protein